MANLLAMSMAIMMSPHSLRTILIDEETGKELDRPTGMWRQSGYLHSALDIMVKWSAIENKKQKLKE